MVMVEHIVGVQAAALTWFRNFRPTTPFTFCPRRAFWRLPAFQHSNRPRHFCFTSYSTHNNSELDFTYNGCHMTLLRRELKQLNIPIEDVVPGQFRCICPKCKGGSTQELSLGVKIDADGRAVWICHRATCGWKGITRPVACHSSGKEVAGPNMDRMITRSKTNSAILLKEFTEEALGLLPLSSQMKFVFSKRGISSDTLNRNGVRQIVSGEEVRVAFPYFKDKRIVNCKYLDSGKNTFQECIRQQMFYGVDDIKEADEIIIVKDEIDKLSLEEAGFLNCISVPNAVNSKVSKKVFSELEDKDYEYVWNCKEHFEKATRIVLATGADETGEALGEELARRIGKEKCWRINWPKYSNGKKPEDANEVLLQFGKERLRNMIRDAEFYPIRGLFRFCDFYKEIDDYYSLRLGDELGVSTGWHNLDEYYRVVPGELTVVTGVPNSGKSEWIDALLCNLNHFKGWSFALCSMENKVRAHGRKLLEKHLRKPFFDAPYSNSMPRMTDKDFEEGKKWLNETFYLIRHDDDKLPSIQWVLNLAKTAVMRWGIRGLVIDPYNELDHQRLPNQTETEYVSQMLTKVKRFAQHHSCHVWFVAHPRQLQGWNGEAPKLYDISGSAHFVNKCDNGLVIHRNRDSRHGPVDQVKVCVEKVRNKAAGTIGHAFLSYDRVTGEYSAVKEQSKTAADRSVTTNGRN